MTTHEHTFTERRENATVAVCDCGDFRHTDKAGPAIVEVTDTARDQAKAQLDHIVELMEWQDHASNCFDDECSETGANDMLEGFEDYHDTDAATEAITENALDVEVDYGWHSIADSLPADHGFPRPEQFRITLCTGGPAVRIVGELGTYAEPTRAWLEYQDWGTPWTEYFSGTAGIFPKLAVSRTDALLNYARQFYFGG